jgi:hypothetical protein
MRLTTLPPRLVSPRSPCPFVTLALAFRLRSAASALPTLTSFLNWPALLRLTYRRSPLCDWMTVRLLIFRVRLVGIPSPLFAVISRSKPPLVCPARSTRETCDTLMMQKMPRELFFVPPMDCKSVESLPAGADWQYEIKFDGYRAIALKQRGEVQLFSRRGNSFTSKYPEVVDALNNPRAKSFILDGEIVALDEQGRHSFSLLQKRTSKRPLLNFYAFDLLRTIFFWISQVNRSSTWTAVC